MNKPIVGLYGLVIVLFGLLVAFTSRWTVFEAEALREKPANRRQLLAEERIRRGRISARDGRAIARSRPLPGDRFVRTYPTDDVFAHAIGYAYTTIGRAGIEREYNDQLTGRRTELVGVVDSLLGEDRVGDRLLTALHPEGQRVALEGLAGRRGAVVALDVNTGEVLVMASTPSFDPNGVDRAATFAELNRDSSAPLLNRATQGLYPPGSTFKVVTAAAALDTGAYTPNSTVDGRNGKIISGVPLNNFGSASYGQVTLTDALTQSVNTVWAEVGVELGRRTMRDYMARFGFYADPPLDYPDAQMTPSGVRKEEGDLVPPTSRRVDVGRMSIGQGDLFATPLQMASVAQTVANGGVRLEPHIVRRVIDPDGRTIDEIEVRRAERVMSEEAASALAAMMTRVVEEGTGTAAALEGIDVAGKTGTAEIDIANRINYPWFIGFTPDVAIAVALERIPGGTGGTIAAPIARAVLETLGRR